MSYNSSYVMSSSNLCTLPFFKKLEYLRTKAILCDLQISVHINILNKIVNIKRQGASFHNHVPKTLP